MSIKIKHPSEWDAPGEAALRYNDVRSCWCGVSGSLPVEFLSGYQFLRAASKYRYGQFEYEGRTFSFATKRVLVMGSDYIRLEGVPMSGVLDTHEEKVEALQQLLATGLINKIRYCEEEASVVHAACPDHGSEQENDYANFHVFAPGRIEEIEKSRWRSQHGVNLAKRLGKVTFEEATPADRPAVQSLFRAWVVWKAQFEKLMYRSLYEKIVGLVGAPQLYGKGMVKCYVLKFDGAVVGCTAWLVYGDQAHLLMNLSAHRAANKPAENTPSELYANLEKKIGYLLYYHVVHAMFDLQAYDMLLGWCAHNDPLLQFKKDMSRNVVRLWLTKRLVVPTPTVTPTPKNAGFGLKGK